MDNNLLELNNVGDSWSARTRISDDESTFFTFDHEPTIDEIEQARMVFIAGRESQIKHTVILEDNPILEEYNG